jgi:hypothetical protein
MFAALAIFFALFVVIYVLLTSAVIHHLTKYTLPGWRPHKIIIPLFITISVIFLLLAAYFLFRLPGGSGFQFTLPLEIKYK